MKRKDFIEAAVCFTAFAALIFGFPWLIVAASHFAGNF